MKKFLSLLLATLLVLSLAACGEKQQDHQGPQNPSQTIVPQDLVMGTGSTGGTYFALGGAMANAINDKLADKKITITAQSTGASVENMNLINAGEMDLGIAMNNVAANAFDGVGAFSSPVTNVSSIGVVYNEVYQIVANAATGAKNVEDLKGKKVAVTWAYSPSYGKPLSCPQSLISLLPRFGMDVTLAHPEGYDLMPEVVERAKGYAAESGTTFKQVSTMAEAFEGADIVIPKSWAPFAAMEKRTNLYAEGDDAGIAALEKELLAQNATHQDWCSTTELMEKTANGQDTIFMHPLPADISGVSCEHGEVNADVFDMHRVGMYKEASYKPYAIAAMMFLQKVADPAATLKALDERNTARWFQA